MDWGLGFFTPNTPSSLYPVEGALQYNCECTGEQPTHNRCCLRLTDVTCAPGNAGSCEEEPPTAESYASNTRCSRPTWQHVQPMIPSRLPISDLCDWALGHLSSTSAVHHGGFGDKRFCGDRYRGEPSRLGPADGHIATKDHCDVPNLESCPIDINLKGLPLPSTGLQRHYEVARREQNVMNKSHVVGSAER